MESLIPLPVLCVVLMRVLLLEVHEAACSEVMALLVDHDRRYKLVNLWIASLDPPENGWLL